MKKPYEANDRDQLRNKIIGLGERSIRKSYYPELKERVAELEKINGELLAEIAARKKTEKLKKKLEEQLNQSMKMEAIGTLAGGIAHDFNNILTAIIGYAELTKLNVAQDCQHKHCPIPPNLDMLLEASHRAKSLIKQILTFSRQQKHERTPQRLSQVIKEAILLLKSTLPSTIDLHEDILEKEKYVMADPTQIHQIIMNLGTNGYHAMRDQGGTLGISLSETIIDKDDMRLGKLYLTPGPYLLLEVSDNGVGMSKSHVERIFNPYFTTKEKSDGTGMGLAMVHGIVKDHKGHITVYSELGKGSTFRVYLPQIVASVEDHVAEQKETVVGGKEKILIVDDEEMVLDLEKKILEKLGYTVSCFHSPLKALSYLETTDSDYDLIITDMTMPGMNGAEFTSGVLKLYPDMPVILCTGFSELINEEKAKAIGVREYIMKPLVYRETAAVVRKVLDGK